MRSKSLFCAAVIAAALSAGLIGLTSPAHAQSFLETLFGGSKPVYAPSNAYRGPNRLLPPGGMGPGGFNNGAPYSIRQMPQPRRGDDEGGDQPAQRGDNGRGYRTVCVRTCDGFYWPVSYAAPRSRFYRDGNVCAASCGSEAKLFHFPAKGGQIEDAVDQSGRVYARLPTAFT